MFFIIKNPPKNTIKNYKIDKPLSFKPESSCCRKRVK